MDERFLEWAWRVVRRRGWWVLGGAVILALLALIYTFFISELKVKSSFLDLLPRGDPLIRRFEESKVALERIDYVQILIALREPPADEEARERLLLEAAERLVSQLKESPEIVEASYRPEVALPEVMMLTPEGQHLLQELVSTSERIRAYLQGGETTAALEGGERLAALYARINAALEEALLAGGGGEGARGSEDEAAESEPGSESGSAPEPALELEAIQARLEELLGLTSTVQRLVELLGEPAGLQGELAHLTALLDQLQREAQERAFFSRDKSAILINARPRLPSQVGLSYCRRVTQLIEAAIERSGLDPERFRVGLTGSYIFTTESDQIIKRDMRNTTIISSVGVALIFILAFGRLLLPLLATIPLFLAMLFTLAWAKLAVGGLNLITTFLPSLIMGLGIDYGVHFIARYLEEQERGGAHGVSRALHQTLLKKGSATLIAAITTAVVLFSLLFARSQGLFEMGAIAGMGILLAALLTLFLLPALIIVSYIVVGRRLRHLLGSRERPPRYRLNVERLVDVVIRKKRWVLILTLLLSVLLLYPAARVKFQFVSQDLIPERMESQLVRREIAERFELAQVKLGDYFVFFAPDEQELARITSQLERLELVESVHSLRDYLGAGAGVGVGVGVGAGEVNFLEQIDLGRRRLALISANLDERAEIADEAERLIINLSSLQALATLYGWGELSVMISSLIQGLATLSDSLRGLDPARIEANLALLEGELARLEGKVREVFGGGDPLARARAFLEERFTTPEGDYIIYVRVDSERIYQKQYYKRFIAEASRITPDFFGVVMIQDRLERYMGRDFWMTTAISAFLILLFLRLGFRRPGGVRLGLLAVLPLALGYLWMLGWMRLLSLEFNFTNILISPLLIGIGVDNGVHILHRYLESREIREATASTAIAILVTSATTMLVFGSLLLAHTPGLRLLGGSALLGIGFTALFSLTALPALIALRD